MIFSMIARGPIPMLFTVQRRSQAMDYMEYLTIGGRGCLTSYFHCLNKVKRNIIGRPILRHWIRSAVIASQAPVNVG